MKEASLPEPDNFQTEPPRSLAGERAVAVGRFLVSASEEFVRSLNPQARTSSDLARAVGVNKDIASRFMTAVAKRDPLAVAYYMPGVESLRRLSEGAKTRSGDLAVIERFEQAIAAFEEFLQDELGGRHALDAMASAWLPEARERFESASRQMAYRAAANLRGVECEMIINSTVIHPGKDPERYDAIQADGVIGVRRLRPGVQIMVATFDHRDDTAGHATQTIDGKPVRGDGTTEEFLPAFGRGEPPEIKVVRAGTSSFYQLVDEGLGAVTASDLYFGHYTPAMMRRWGRMPGDIAATMEGVEVPAQRLVFDVLLHPDVWPGIDPELMFYGTFVRGVALPYDRARDMDRVDLLDQVRFIGTGIECCRVADAPKYVELLRWACEKRGWDPAKFRVFRCDARYPVYGVQYTLAFRLQERPAAR